MKSKGLNSSTLSQQYTHLLHIIRFCGYKIGIKYNRGSLVVEKNSWATKIVNDYIVYELNTWPKNPLDNFTLKNCLIVATNIVKNKRVYSRYGIAYDGKESWSFGDDFARNVVILGVDNSSPSHSDNCKNNSHINGSYGSWEKKLVLILVKQMQHFA